MSLPCVYWIEPTNHAYDKDNGPMPIVSPRGFFTVDRRSSEQKKRDRAPQSPEERAEIDRKHDMVQDLRRAGRPLPVEYVPQGHEFDGHHKMPDFFYIFENNYHYASSRFRDVVEEFAPGVLEFLPVKFLFSARLRPAAQYYFINVLGRDTLIDWGVTDVDEYEAGVYYERHANPLLTRFRRPSNETPAFWHERDVVIGENKYISLKGFTFGTSMICEILDSHFPDQVIKRAVPHDGSAGDQNYTQPRKYLPSFLK